MSAAFQKFAATVNSLADGAMNLGADTLNLMLLTPVGAPSAAAVVYGDLAAQELGFGNGYQPGGYACARNSSGQVNGLYTLVLAPLTFEATGSMGPFRYFALYSQSTRVLVKPLIGWWDYGSPVTLSEGQPFTVDFDQTLGTVTLQ